MYHGPENLALTTGEKSTLFGIEPTTFELHCIARWLEVQWAVHYATEPAV